MKIVYVDMDDTICHFSMAYYQAIKDNPKIGYPQSQYGFFANLEPIKDAIRVINLLRQKFDVYILTRPSVMNPLCYTEKRVWIEKYFGLDFCDKLILCPNKSLLKGDFLIDDVRWEGFEGEQLLYGEHPFPNWFEVYHYMMNKV